MRTTIAAASLSLLVACSGQGKKGANDQRSEPSVPVPATTDLTERGFPLLFTPPDPEMTGGVAPTIAWKEETGALEIRAGERFALEIREEPADIARLKGTLDRDLIRKNTVLSEAPDQIVWKSEFPDDPSLVFLHFYHVVQAGDRVFVVQDIDGPAYNQQDIDRMRSAISAKPSI